MDTIYVIRNQHTQYLTRKKEWVDGREAQPLYKTPYHDVGLNELIEINAKDIQLRCELLTCETTEKGLPVITEFGAEALKVDEGNDQDESIISEEADSSENERIHIEATLESAGIEDILS